MRSAETHLFLAHIRETRCARIALGEYLWAEYGLSLGHLSRDERREACRYIVSRMDDCTSPLRAARGWDDATNLDLMGRSPFQELES